MATASSSDSNRLVAHRVLTGLPPYDEQVADINTDGMLYVRGWQTLLRADSRLQIIQRANNIRIFIQVMVNLLRNDNVIDT